MFAQPQVLLMLVNLLLFIPRAIIMIQPGALLGATAGIMYTSGQLDILRECV
jgi:uncharacterized membrane protein YdjX (TVP38/TMEM64 family)